MASALVIAAPMSGSGKTVVTLGLLRALRNRGVKVASAKVGPDYIDPRFHEAATDRPCFNLDIWAMGPARLNHYMSSVGQDADIVIVEGVMGLFDGPECGLGSTADIANHFGLPIVLVIDCASMAQSVAALARGFAQPNLAALILNRVASERHERILRQAIGGEFIIAGNILRDSALALPSRHLGLVQATERGDLESFLETAAATMARAIDLDAFVGLAKSLKRTTVAPDRIPPLGSRIAVANDIAFAFAYPHMLDDWRAGGTQILPFSPLADEAPSSDADAIFLPGGYPELHAARLSANRHFFEGLRSCARRGVLIYGECGGYMVLGEYLIDAEGRKHEMARLLPVSTNFANRKLHLGYRRLSHSGVLPFPRELRGHEFHYSTIDWQGEGESLFACRDACGNDLPPAGLRRGNVMGSYAHIIA